MALEDEVSSLTGRIDQLARSLGEKLLPTESSVEKMERSISEGFENLQETVSDLGGGVEPRSNVQNIEQQVESVVSQEVDSIGFETIAETVAETTEVEPESSASGEELVSNLKEQLEGVGEEAGFGKIKENLSALDETVNEFAGSANASEENINNLEQAFGEFREGVEGVSESVMEGDASLEQAQSTITELGSQLDEQFSELVGEEGFEGAIEMLRESSSTFVDNFKEASEAAKEVQMQQAGFTGQTFIEVGGAVSEIGGGELSFIQTASDRISNLFQTLTGQIDSVKQNLSEAFTMEGGIGAAQGDLQEVETVSGAIATRFGTIVSNISAARVTLTAILAPLAVAADLVEDVYNVARDFREETGIGAERMRELRRETAMTSSELAEFGLDPSAFGEIAGTLREEFGSVETAIARTGAATQRELATQVGALAEGFALSASEAANLQANLTRIEETTGISSRQLAQQTRELAMQNDVAPQAAIQDIAENSSQVAKFSGQSASGLAEAAVRAQELGVNLEKVASFQEGVLTDITGTVEGLQKASMLTGQQINSTALIEASYQGQEEALNELEAQLSGINLENLNPFARMSLEDAIPGMNFEDIQSLIEGRRELDRLNTQAERTRAMLEGDVSFEQVITEDSVDEVAQLSQSFNALYFTIAEELYPVLSNLTQSLIPGLTVLLKGITPILSGLAKAAQLVLLPIQGLNYAIQSLSGNTDKAKESLSGIKQSFKSIISPFDSLLGLFGMGSEKAKELNSTMGVIAETFKAAGIAAGTYLGGSYIASAVAGLYSLAGGVGALGTAFSLTGIGTIITAIAAAITGATYAFNNWNSVLETTMPYINSISSFFYGLYENLMTVEKGTKSLKGGFVDLQGIMYLVNGAISLIGDSIPYVVSGFQKLMSFGSMILEALQLDHIGSMIGNVVGYVSNLIQKVYQSEEAMGAVRQALDPVMSVLNVMFDPVIDAISYVSELVELFYNLGTAVVQGNFGNLDEILLEGLKSVGESFIDLIIPFNLEGVVKDRMSSIFGSVVPYINETIEIISQAFSGFISLVSDGLSILGSIAEFFQLDHILNAIGTAIEYVANLVTKMLESESAMNTFYEAFDAAIQPMQTALSYLIDPFVDIIGYVTELTELFYDLGAAVVQGNFSNIGGILLEGIGDLGTSMLEVLFPPGIEGMVIEKVTSLASYLRDGIGNLIDSVSNVGENLIRSIVPDSVLQFVGEKMDAVASTIRSYLPFSPAEEGPLAELDMVGEALIGTIFGDNVYDFVSEKISQLTSVISDGIMNLGEGILNVLGIGGGEEQQSAAAPTPQAAEASKFSIQNATISVSSADINFANAQQEASSRLTSVVSEEEITTRNIEQNAFSDSLISSQSLSQQFDSSNQTFSSEQFTEEFSSSFNSEQIEGDTVEIESPEIQPQSPDVATPDSSVVTAPQQAQSFQTQQQTEINEQTDEIRLDSSEDDIEAVLNEILNTQRQFLQELRDGNIAVYLDGRKVNNEMLRSV